MNENNISHIDNWLFLKKYADEDLEFLEIHCGIIFGSAVYGHPYRSTHSDVDVCFFSKNLSPEPSSKFVQRILSTQKDFGDKLPYYIDDNIGRRIEYSLYRSGQSFDINIFVDEPPGLERLYINSCRDGVDMLIPALYSRGVFLFGIPPEIENVNRIFFPFYNDDIRKKRLHDLYDRIMKLRNILSIMLIEKRPDAIDTLFRLREYFLKYLFILNKKYPYSLFKNIENQLKVILKLNEDEINSIMLVKKTDIYTICHIFIEVCDKYLLIYEKGE